MEVDLQIKEPKTMYALLIDETKGTPRVSFKPNGELLIEGHSLPENPARFYRPLQDWIKTCRTESITLDIRLIYLNMSSAKELRLIFRFLQENPYIKSVRINWHYEEGDDDCYDTGREFEASTGLHFQFHEYAEVF